jgi:CheY-like chemotaxis protein
MVVGGSDGKVMNIERLSKRNNRDIPTSTLLSDKFDPTPEFERLLEWVRLGASHVRKNMASIEEHRQRLRARGETKIRLSEFDQWRPSPVFTEREKAGLNLSQALSLPEPDELWTLILKDARRHFSTHQIVRLTLAIVAVNDRIDFHAKSYDRVLVVEDNPWDEEFLLHQLRKTQMADSALFVQNGCEALELIEDSRRSEWGFMAIFLDLHLPDMSGVELLQRIRTMPGGENIPVIMMTPSKNPRDMEECNRLKVTSYVEKPVTFNSFSKAVANISHPTRETKP